MGSLLKFIVKQIDAMIYGFIGPFTILFILPRFFLDLENKFGLGLEINPFFKYVGIFFMNFGGLLAIFCALTMYFSKKASPSPFSKPQKVISNGPFKYVRHPMMWSLHFVLIGQIFIWSSPMIFIWFLIWIRFASLYISRYEEPYLISIFKEEYMDYCNKTPRWFPNK